MKRIICCFLIPSVLVSYCFFSASTSDANSSSEYLLSEATYRKLNAINKLREEDKPREALTRLQSLAPRVRKDAYEFAVVLQTIGYVYHTLGQDEKAAQTFEQALAQEALPEKVSADLRYNLAQLLISTGRYRRGLDVLTAWLNKEKTPPPDAYFLAATANYHLGRCVQTIDYLTKAMAATREAPESWYQLLLTCHYERSQFTQAARVLEAMIEHFPDQSAYWMQLAGVYQRLNRNRDALIVMELAYRKHRLKARDILRLVRLYLYLDMPYSAARLLEVEMAAGRVDASVEHWTLLADSYYLAHEREPSTRALRKAAELANDGRHYFRLGQILFELEQWKEAMNALKSAIDKDGLEQPEMAYMLLGVAAFRSGDRAQAQISFSRALKSAKTRRQAGQWLERLHSMRGEATRP